VIAALELLLPIAEGRGGDPDKGGGILLILGIIVLVIVAIATILFLVTRVTSRRGRSSGGEG